MDLPDCPPGAEGYEDSVVEVPKKFGTEDANCTKAEQEFQEHLNSLKIKVEHGQTRCMVERRGRDISGKWIYLCYPCAAMCSGESILQTHISGKKHKTKLSMRNVWPQSIFDEHPFVLNEKGANNDKTGATEKVLQKMAEEVNYHNNPSELEIKYSKYRNARCHIQDTLDACKTPLVGVEYLVEHPPEEAHYEPSYLCTLCSKQGHPRTIINHMTCFWHRYNYILRHFNKASQALAPYKNMPKYREGVSLVMNRLINRIEDKYGRLRPVHIDKQEYEKEKDRINQWLFKSPHFHEKDECTFEEVVDTDLIESLHKSMEESNNKGKYDKKDPSPPTVAAPTKPLFNSYTRSAGRQERRPSPGLSDISDDEPRRDIRPYRQNKFDPHAKRYEPYRDKRRESPPLPRYTNKAAAADKTQEKQKAPNYEYKVQLAEDQRKNAEEAAKKTLAYHEKNPEKHPQYPEEWKKFWNRRYKEIQAEGKDPSKHDFKPEWILFWTTRMKELHEEELKVIVCEIYRKMCLSPPDMTRPVESKSKANPKRSSPDAKSRSIEGRRSPDPRRRSPDPRRRSPDPRRRSPDPRRRSPDPRRRSPDPRRRSPDPRRRSPDSRHPGMRRSPDSRHSGMRRSPDPRHPGMRRSPDPRHRSPVPRRSPGRPPLRRSDDRYRRDYRSPGRHIPHEHAPSPGRSMSQRVRSRSPVHREHGRGSRSPLSRRAAAVPLRNRSRSPPNTAPPPSLQTVLISDDELKPDDGLSPWNSDNDMDSILSQADRSPTAGSVMSRSSRAKREFSRPAQPSDLGPAENVVATLRLLVALEDYLGSVGPKVVDLLTEALRMEKEKANSSEELLDRDSAVVLMETAKEKLKGAVQAGLVPAGAAPALRAAVVRTAATLHAADTRARDKAKVLMPGPAPSVAAPAPAPARKRTRTRPRTRRRPRRRPNGEQTVKPSSKNEALPVAGVGEVNRAQIAQQMAAALIAQGKTDVSSEELAQLVDAVVGMAEAKKREAEVKKAEVKVVVASPVKPSPPAAGAAGAAGSALQMLQSAYNENDKRIEKEEAPDAMDGLSDSDLETLLKNFNELSAEEQHSLIAYLKKLEAREPQRVERLRQYVSAAATTATSATSATTATSAPAAGAVAAAAPAPEPAKPAQPADDLKPVTIESDDDDYTVEEVFESATKKVKEDQIRHEMEIVKKSLEESKIVTAAPSIDLSKNLSSATDLLALVQASIQSTASTNQAPSAPAADVVTSNTQPRSFGDLPEPTIPQEPAKAPLLNPPVSQPFNQGLLRTPQTNMNFNNNMSNQNDSYDNQDNWNQGSAQNYQDKNSYNMQDSGSRMQDNRGPMQDNRGPYSQENRGPLLQRGPNEGPNRGPLLQGGNFQQDNRTQFQQLNNRAQFQQPDIRAQFQQPDNRGQFQQSDNRAQFQQPDNRAQFQQPDSRAQFQQQENRGPLLQDNSGPLLDNRGFQQNRGLFMQGQQMQNRQFPMQNNRGPNMQDNRGPLLQNNQPLLQNNQQPYGQSMPDNRGGAFMQENRGLQQQRGNFGQDSYNQGPRNNFMNGNNFDTRQSDQQQQQQQFGNNQKNFRGRGGGRGQRGRGRGGFFQ